MLGCLHLPCCSVSMTHGVASSPLCPFITKQWIFHFMVVFLKAVLESAGHDHCIICVYQLGACRWERPMETTEFGINYFHNELLNLRALPAGSDKVRWKQEMLDTNGCKLGLGRPDCIFKFKPSSSKTVFADWKVDAQERLFFPLMPF